MPRQTLTGTLEEQCAFLFSLAQEKASAGNYAGARHALKEILKYRPDYPGAQELMAQVVAGGRQQRLLLWFSLGGASLGVILGTLLQLPNDLWFLLMGAAGALVGWFIGNMIAGRTRS